MKKLTLILWLLLSTTICTFAYDFQSGDLYYNITSDSTVEVTYQEQYSDYNYFGLTSAIIPESVTYNGTTYGVTSIGGSAFEYCSGLTSVTIPNSVTSIGDYAFYGCHGLTSITIPNGVINIGRRAFDRVPNIVYSGTATGAPWGARSMNGYVDGCLVYSDVTRTNLLACYNTVTGAITIPNSVTNIGYEAFRDCSGLTSVTIPNSVTSIGERAFRDCSGLTSITIPNSVTSIGSSAFSDCSGLTSITIPNGVTSIGDYAFSGCIGLTSVTIPNSVTSIGRWAFNGVPNIVYSGTAEGAPWGARCMNGYVDGYLVYSDATKTTLLACSSAAIGNITIPDSVTGIGSRAFYYCSSLTSVTIGNSVTSIGDGAFSGCSGLTSVTIGNSVTNIGGGAFSYCSGLTSITIPNSVTSIGESAFLGCSGLTSVTIGDSVTTIGTSAFQYCSGLMSVTIPNSVTSIGSGAFRSCTGLTSITIGNNVTNIEDHVFDGCTSLMSVVWNAKYCSDFTSSNTPFYYHDSIESSNNFDLNSQITSFAFGDCVQHIPAYICDGMKNLTSVTIGNSTTSIGDYAFRDCSGLTSITIPQDVMSIGTYSFRGCTSLMHVKWNALDYTATNPFYCDAVGDAIEFDLRKQITSFVCSDSIYAISPNICAQMTNLDTLIAPTIIWDSEDVDVEHQPKNLKYIKLLNGELTETIQSILSGSRKTIRTLDLDGVSNTEIPDEAFREFYKMDTLVLPAQLTKIPYKAVSECVALQSIVVPEGVTDIEYGAFSGCSGLQTLSLPSTLQSIADNGFASCSALKEMRVHAQTPPTVYANTFSGVKRTIPVYVPQSAYNDYTTADVWKEFFIQSDVADGVENVPSNDTRNQDVHKVLRNGQVYIIRGDQTYTLTGEEVK